MDSKKVNLAGSELQPIGTRVGDQPDDETIEVSVILKPKVRAVAPHARRRGWFPAKNSRPSMAPIAGRLRK